MPATVHIVGQGIAGVLLAWELEKRGVEFQVYDLEAAESGSRVGAGIINPVTGLRWAKSWRIAELLPLAFATYREMEAACGSGIFHPLPVRRFFQSDEERQLVERRLNSGLISDFVTRLDDRSCLIQPAARVDTALLVQRFRERYRRAGRFVVAEPPLRGGKGDYVVRAIGAAETTRPDSAALRLSVARGEILNLSAPGFDRSAIVNAGHWILPIDGDGVKVGATYDRTSRDLMPTPAARDTLLAFARAHLATPFELRGQDVGFRVSTPDRLPVVGFGPADKTVGIINGLGSKGALFAPYLARAWADHLHSGKPFDRELDAGRFLK